MDLEKEFGVDKDLAEEGVWVRIGDAELQIAAMSNTRVDRFLDPHRRRYRRLGAELPESLAEEALAQFVLLGWKGIKDQGVVLEPAEENRLAMIRKYPSFKRLVIQLAMDESNFREQQKEAEQKN